MIQKAVCETCKKELDYEDLQAFKAIHKDREKLNGDSEDNDNCTKLPASSSLCGEQAKTYANCQAFAVSEHWGI